MSSASIRHDNRKDYGEARFNALGFLDTRLYVLTFTMRGEVLRAISLRKAEPEERDDYDANYEAQWT